MADQDEDIYYEFQRIGNYLRLSAIDAASGREVVVSGPVGSEEMLKRTAIRKLHYVLGKNQP